MSFIVFCLTIFLAKVILPNIQNIGYELKINETVEDFGIQPVS